MEHPSAGGASSRLGHYELTDLKTFQVVAECGSISKASRRMGTTKSVVSQRISRLERALGSDLFARSRRGVVLTDQGVLYLAQTAEALSLLMNSYAAQTAAK